MASLFISHSSRDRVAASAVRDRLEAEGYGALFIDFDPERGIPAGRRWERELYAQLRRADAVVFLASAASVASRWCFAELSLARSLGRPVFPVRLEGDADIALLADVQWIDLAEGDPAFARLLAGLRRAGLDPADSFAWDAGRSPYPGLEPFMPDDAAVFFGREREVDRLLELLQPTLRRDRGRFVAIVGPSGSGKSSLLHAGLLPRLARLGRLWLPLPAMMPGSRPTQNLAYSLAGAFDGRNDARSLADIEALLARGPPGLGRLASELSGGRVNVLVVIDQAEELITRCGAGEQRRFLALLDGAMRDDSPLWAVATMRSEFLSPRPERAGLAEAVDDVLVVEPLSRARLPEVITRPAQRAGLEFAPGLPERMVDETTGGDALPLLAYTLRELSQRAGRDGVAGWDDYEAVGGVEGALQRRADRLLDELDRRGLGALVLPTLMKLAAVEGEGEPTRRRIDRDTLNGDEQAVMDAFVDARLLTSGESPSGERTVEVSHEALLRRWPPLREEIEAARSELQIRSDVERLAADWDQAGRDESYLLRGARLGAVEGWAREHVHELSRGERQFLEASQAMAARDLERARRSNRRLRVLVSGLAVLLLVALGASAVALRSSDEAKSQARLALSRQLAVQAERLVEERPDSAILLGLQSLSLARDEEPDPTVPVGLVTGLARLTHESRRLTGHRDQVHEVAFGNDGTLLASAAWDGTVRFWQPRTGEPGGRALVGHRTRLTSVALSPDDRLVASGGRDGEIRIWERRSGRPHGRPLTGHRDVVTALAFSPDGTLLASGGDDGTARLWEAASGRSTGSALRGHSGPVQDVEFSPDGRLLATAGVDGTARLWDVRSGRPRDAPLQGHTNDVWGVAFSPDGQLLATASADNTVRLWSVRSGAARGDPLEGHTDNVWDAAFSPDGRLLATASADNTVRLWEVASGRPVGQPLRGHTNDVGDVDFSPDGKLLASAGWDDAVRVWKTAETVSVSRPLVGHRTEVLAVRSSPESGLLASAAADGEVQLWDVPSGRERGAPWRAHANEVNALAFSSDGALLGSASSDGTARLWRMPSGQPYSPALTGHRGRVYGVAFSPSGTLLATSGEDDTARLWDVGGASVRQPLDGHEEDVWAVAFSADGRYLATASGDQTVLLWNARSRKPVGRPLGGHADVVRAAAFSPRDDLLATAGADGTARVWKVPSGRPVGPPLGGHDAPLWDVAFSPRGDRLATAGADGTARLWEMPSGEAVGYPLSGHSGEVYSLAFSRDGRQLATAGADGTVRLWRPSFDEWVEYGCRLVNRNLSLAEWERVASGLDYERTCPDLPSGQGAPAGAPAAHY